MTHVKSNDVFLWKLIKFKDTNIMVNVLINTVKAGRELFTFVRRDGGSCLKYLNTLGALMTPRYNVTNQLCRYTHTYSHTQREFATTVITLQKQKQKQNRSVRTSHPQQTQWMKYSCKRRNTSLLKYSYYKKNSCIQKPRLHLYISIRSKSAPLGKKKVPWMMLCYTCIRYDYYYWFTDVYMAILLIYHLAV